MRISTAMRIAPFLGSVHDTLMASHLVRVRVRVRARVRVRVRIELHLVGRVARRLGALDEGVEVRRVAEGQRGVAAQL